MSGEVGFVSNRDNAKIFKIIDTIKPRTQKAVRETWYNLGRDLKNEADREILRKPKRGRAYFIRTRKSGRVRRHVASAPGESHANLSGKLRRSISWKVHGSERMEFGYGFSTTASNSAPEYDIYVEDGVPERDTGTLEPRPSIENAVKKIKRTTTNHFQRAMLGQFQRV